MKILHINLAKGFRGGERQTEILIKTLANKPDIKQSLACRKDSPLRHHLAKVINLDFVDADNQILGHFSATKFDIMHAHDAKAVHWAYLHKLLTNTPYIITRRVDQDIKKKWFNKKSYSNAASIVAISSLIKTLIQQRKWNTNIQLIPSVMADFKVNKSITNSFKSEFNGKILIGNAGALVDKHKGQRLLIETARNLKKSHPHFQFIIFGRGEDEAILKKESHELDNITWAGFKENIADHIAALDIFAFPSRNEGLGSTLLDVMNAGVPIIAADVGGIPDIVIHKKTGLLFEVNNAKALEESLLELIKTPEKQKEYILNAKSQLKKYSPNAMTNSYLKLYKQFIF
ncbi:glycosyltransferase family 4 protein [Marinomonas sp. PE14-40]|uniref:glycosyltransferase family 4 protein n=1 Tax=Marinomonas sp. PE14-40 TaxID=3060621 RepID=UPI003F6641C0